MNRSGESFDVAILGGGPAGATAAMVLARTGVRALMVEQASGAGFAIGEGLPPAARPLLRDLGVWDRFRAAGHLESYGNESAWGDAIVGTTHFVGDPNGSGWHLDRARFDAMLRDAARDAGARVMTSTRARRAVRTSEGWSVTLAHGDRQSTVCARWLIDCTGRRAWAARLCGVRRVGVDHLVAFVSRCEAPRPSSAAPPSDVAQRFSAAIDLDSLTLVESAAHGWWYTSRLPAGDRVVAYLTDAHDASARRACTRQGFSTLLNQTVHVRERLAAYAVPRDTPPRIVAADTSRLERPAGDGWLAAGDAAVSFDPLSSQGILTALYSGMRAAQALTAHLAGERSAVDAYCDRLDTIYSAYLDHRRQYYRQERRWPAHPFWRARQNAGDPPADPVPQPQATAHI